MVSCVAKVYTPEILELFQAEYEKSLNCFIYIHGKVGHVIEYKIHRDRSNERTILFDSATEMVTCISKKFEFMGIQCCHVLKVLDHRNIKFLPPQYILTRWTRDAKFDVVHDICSSSIQVDMCLLY
ncbi:Protein FAR-RED ELONGATED HYPOCOTYL 3 [Acorus gramineus]|uniref:Protein FAR1-RELATED SEQUENCE n=1 Tax=Acorus gramineus TaxID=55184 RepID=A0AAV8ZZM2_ACOGR|nr:Protein FAR-RED ELONGATED HYPOCOTYL 3 [Acorus gramineus]